MSMPVFRPVRAKAREFPLSENSRSLPGILLVAFGVTTRYGKPALAAFTDKVRSAFPGHIVHWAFTAKHQVKRPTLSGEPGMSVERALTSLARKNITSVAVQPLHLTAGREYSVLRRQIETWQNQHPGMTFSVGSPLLTGADSADAVLSAMHSAAAPLLEPDEAPVWVGHGSKDPLRTEYLKLAAHAEQSGHPLFLGCISGGRSADEILGLLQRNGKNRVCLLPFFALSGYHAAKDVAGKNEGSWKSRFAKAGISCRVHLQGLVEYDVFAALWLARLREALVSATHK